MHFKQPIYTMNQFIITLLIAFSGPAVADCLTCRCKVVKLTELDREFYSSAGTEARNKPIESWSAPATPPWEYRKKEWA